MRILTLFSVILVSLSTWAWGERGHRLIGETAARSVDNQLANHKDFKKLGLFYEKRALQMGHLNNIPDISWKSQNNPIIKEHNGPSHYFDLEHFLGFPKKSNDPEYLEKARNLPDNFGEMRRKYDGKKHPTKGTPLDIYKESGTAVFRIGELYNRALDLMKCASEREGEAFNKPLFPMDGQHVVESTKCKNKTTKLEALLASTTLLGLMGHFVADLSQPQHNSADYNGWMTGQGGLHSYFETVMVLAMSEDLTGKVTKRAEKLLADGTADKRLGEGWKKLSAVKLALRLSADGFSNLDKLRELDRKYALIKESRTDKRSKMKVPAERKDPTNPAIWKKFENFAVDRMAMSTIVLSHLMGKAWLDGGRPDIAEIVFWKAPYPLDSAYILNDYRPIQAPKKSLFQTNLCYNDFIN